MKFFSKTRLEDSLAKKERKQRTWKGPISKRYWDDFEVKTELNSKGKPKRKLVYIGDTYTALVPETVFRRRKITFLLTSILCALVFVSANCVNVSSNRQGLLAALGILIVIPLFLVCYACICRLRKARSLRRGEYIETSMFLKFGSFFTAALGLVLFLWHGIFVLRSALPSELSKELFVTCAWGILAGCSVYLWVAEITTEYRQHNREGNTIQKEHFKRNG